MKIARVYFATEEIEDKIKRRGISLNDICDVFRRRPVIHVDGREVRKQEVLRVGTDPGGTLSVHRLRPGASGRRAHHLRQGHDGKREEEAHTIMSKKKKIPTFKTDAEEHEFWMTHDSSDYESQPIADGEIEFDIPVKKVISLRIDPGEYEGIKRIAKRKRVRPTSLMRDWVDQRYKREITKLSHAHPSPRATP